MLDDEVHFLLMRAFNSSNRAVVERTGAMGLLPGQPKVIDYLMSHPDSFQREIADGCLYLPAATTAETLLTELTGADIRITSAGGEALAGKDPVGTGATLAQGEGEAELVVVLGGTAWIFVYSFLVFKKIMR